MPMRIRTTIALLLAALLVGCAGGDGGDDAQTPAAEGTTAGGAETTPATEAATDGDGATDGAAAPTTEAGAAAADCSPTTARASHHITGESAAHRGLEVLAEELAQRTDGRLTLEIFSDAQLGGLGEMTDNLRSGAIDVALIDSGTLSQYEPELGVFDLPFLFSDMDAFNELMDGEVGEAVNERITENVDVIPLYWSAVGLRSMFFVDREVTSADDLAGLTMRVPEAPVWVDTFEALGTSPTAIPSSELYTALQSGVVDGFEFPLGTAVDLRMYEPVSFMTRTEHILTNILIAASPTFVDGLCEQDAQAVTEAAEVAQDATRQAWKDDNDAAETVLAENLTIVEDPDLDSFREAIAPVHEGFTAANGSELYDQIQEALGGP